MSGMKRRALVVGASGFLGRAVTAELRRQNVTVYGTYCQQALADIPFDFWRDDVTPILEQTGADTVIFTAAVETDAPTLELKARAAHFFRACASRRVVYLSSDAIFDGAKGNYRESDSPSPTILYGKNLMELESLVQGSCKNTCIIRPSYLYGFSAELDPRLLEVQQRLLAGKDVYYAQDFFKSPVEITLAAEAVAKLALSSTTGAVHISGARTSVYNFYQGAMTVLGVPVETLHAEYLPADAAIPKDTSLDATLMTQLTGVPVASVLEALTKQALPLREGNQKSSTGPHL